MGIFTRFADIMSANINDLLDRCEKPEKMAKQYLRQAMEDLAEVKKETASIMAEEKRCKRNLDEATGKVEKYATLAKKAVGNGAQVVDALANAHLNGTAAGGCGTGVEIRQARQHQAVAGLGHFQGESLADDGLAVQRQSAVHLHRAHRHDDDIVAF